MTVNEFVKKNGWYFNIEDNASGFWNVNIGFVNSSDGNDDETEFSIKAYDVDELEELFDEFCEENELMSNAVTYVSVVETAESEDELS